MSFNYDAVRDFIDYTSVDEWRNYVKNYVIPVWRNAFILKEFYEDLKNELKDALLDNVNEEDLPLLLGGVIPTKDGITYSENSLAKFYNKFFGLKVDDLQSWALGSELTGRRPKVMVEETPFIRFVKEVFQWSDRAIHHQRLIDAVEPEVDYVALKRDPNKLKGLIEDFYRSVLKISVNYNYHTFFLWSIKQIPYKFMKEAYPRIDQMLDFLITEFGLTRYRWKSPFSEGSKLHYDYTIWCWPEYNAQSESGGRSFGGAISRLNETIWNHLTRTMEVWKTFADYFTTAPDLKGEHKRKVEDKLTGRRFDAICYRGITAAEERSKLDETGLTLMQMLDEISPYLFTGLAKISSAVEGCLLMEYI